MKTKEHAFEAFNGWAVLMGVFAYPFVATPFAIVLFPSVSTMILVSLIILLSLLTIAWVFVMVGFYTLQPNQAAALILFGQVDAQPAINTGSLY